MLDTVYSDLILYHNKNLQNKRKLTAPTMSERGFNPSCGDDIRVEIEVVDDIVKDLAYNGCGCAISQASASIMIDLIKEKSVKEAIALIQNFLGVIRSEIEPDTVKDALGDAIFFKNITNLPGRVKCAVLAWHTLDRLLNSDK